MARTTVAGTPAAAASAKKAPKDLPAPNSDFYQLVDVVTADEVAIVKRVRAYMETKVQPIINKYWSEDAFPFELLPSFKELQIGGLGYQGYGCAGGNQKLFGLVAMELARVDASLCTSQSWRGQNDASNGRRRAMDTAYFSAIGVVGVGDWRVDLPCSIVGHPECASTHRAAHPGQEPSTRAL
jgi:Acyl-CoA dehydrogenase, N-terminal domain